MILSLGAWSLRLYAWGLRLVVRGSRSLALEAWGVALSSSFFIYFLVFAIAHGRYSPGPARSTAAALVALLRSWTCSVVA